MKKWDKYLNGDYDVVLDNDQWFFTYKKGKEPKDFDPEEDSTWIEVGGTGPYGQDLLIHVLNQKGIEVEFV